MTTRPTDLFTWGGTQVAPSAGKMAAGFAVSEKPPAEYLNWLLDNLSDWQAYQNALKNQICILYRSVPEDLATGDFIPSWMEASDVAAMHAGGSYAVTAPETGIYRVDFNGIWDGGEGGTYREASLWAYVGGAWSQVQGCDVVDPVVSTLNISSSWSGLVTLEAGNSLGVKVAHDTGSTAKLVRGMFCVERRT